MNEELHEGGVEKFSPLKPAELNVLLALAGGEMHGYGIKKDVADRTAGKVKLGPGTLYRTLNSLLERGRVEDTGIEEESEGGRRRRYYRITGLGRKAAAAEVERLEEIVTSARKRGISDRGLGPIIG
ncbi:MAG: PadR family transcriptional regulator, partial [Rubrobacteraceae bacterium]